MPHVVAEALRGSRRNYVRELPRTRLNYGSPFGISQRTVEQTLYLALRVADVTAVNSKWKALL